MRELRWCLPNLLGSPANCRSHLEGRGAWIHFSGLKVGKDSDLHGVSDTLRFLEGLTSDSSCCLQLTGSTGGFEAKPPDPQAVL